MSDEKTLLFRLPCSIKPPAKKCVARPESFGEAMRRLETMAGKSSASLSELSDAVLKLAEGDNADDRL